MGCSVLTRPSKHSGKPVRLATSVTGIPASCKVLYVPPVDKRVTLAACNDSANGSMFVLSETDNKALLMVRGVFGSCSNGLRDIDK